MPLGHRDALLFCYLLLFQSDRVVFAPDVGFRFVWRRRSRARRFHSCSNSSWSLAAVHDSCQLTAVYSIPGQA